MMEVTLTDYELYMAAGVGIRRVIESKFSGLKDAHGYNGKDEWTINIEGAAAELAFAKAMGVYWDGSVNTFKHPDVGRAQVRYTHHPGGGLIVRPDDDPTQPYVLVIGKSPTYKIIGSMFGKDAKQKIWFDDKDNNRPPCYFVPQHALHPFQERGK